MKWMKGVMLMGFVTALIGCSGGGSGALMHYKDAEPKLVLEDFFDGTIKGWGMIQDSSGKVTRRFDVEIIASWDGDNGILDETFVFYDGETDKRIWKVKKIDDRNYVGTAGDIIGEATGEQEGNALRWAYQMDLTVDGRTFRMTFDDWMYLMNDGVLINRSYIKKFGITFAELTLFMQKQDS
ncbi:MAG: DUF3833 domain-containing protein [Pseudomonadota bacterium]